MTTIIYTLSFLVLAGLLVWAIHISTCREGRTSKGRFTRKAKTVKRQLFYSDFRKELI